MKGKSLVEYRMPDVRTLYDVLRKGKELSNNGKCLGMRPSAGKGAYEWITYDEVMKLVEKVGAGLIAKGIESNNLTSIGIYSANRSEVSQCFETFPII
jgi:long-chain acyl-CoA synthetase